MLFFYQQEYLKCNNPSSPRSDVFPGMPSPLHSFGSNVSLYGTDVVIEDQRQSVEEIAQHVLYSKLLCFFKVRCMFHEVKTKFENYFY